MAENSSNQPAAQAQAEVQGLSQSDLKLLAVSGKVLKDFHPKPGVLHDLPQITIESGDIAKVCRLAKQDPRLALNQLLCLACVDYKEYFQLVYFLRSFEPSRLLVVKTDVPYDDPRAPSVVPVWRAAEWYEREAHDLFGVLFDGHPDLAPLLLYEGFEGFPGRKEYPFYDYQEF
ncbi:MAG: NADH-quinone oxidoreductase subunit C [Dehalococcoidia bacterium]|nr:NADH-quinone oxidoreductase subunit C [Dehalococcoidia bacterium]